MNGQSVVCRQDIKGQLHFSWHWWYLNTSRSLLEWHVSRNMTSIHHLEGFQFLVGRFRLCKVRNILNTQISVLNFTSGVDALAQRPSGWGAGAIVEGGGGVMVTVCPVLAPSPAARACLLTAEWHHQGGPLSPPFFFLGALKFCTQRLHGAPISRSEWTQHFWKSLTRLNHSAISCQSAHTSCFSELT